MDAESVLRPQSIFIINCEIFSCSHFYILLLLLMMGRPLVFLSSILKMSSVFKIRDDDLQYLLIIDEVFN